ncbi:hypothetical protein D3C84_924180 [compost metagenome]
MQLVDKTPVTGSEILGAKVEGAGIAAPAGHASPAAVALVEQMNGLPGFLQCLGRGKAGNTGPDDGNRYSHDGLFEPYGCRLRCPVNLYNA